MPFTQQCTMLTKKTENKYKLFQKAYVDANALLFKTILTKYISLIFFLAGRWFLKSIPYRGNR